MHSRLGSVSVISKSFADARRDKVSDEKRAKYPDLLTPYESGLRVGEDSLLSLITSSAVAIEETQKLVVAPAWEFYAAAQERRKRLEEEVRRFLSAM
jgi:hypothetical protein